ncbi:MAG: hypothetical protein ACOCXX_01340 [Planctomycetota bacterium]
MNRRFVAIVLAVAVLPSVVGCAQGPDSIKLPEVDRLPVEPHSVVVDELFGRTRLVVYATDEPPRLVGRRVLEGPGLGVVLASHRGRSLHTVYHTNRIARVDYTGADDAVVRLLMMTHDPRTPDQPVGLVQTTFAVDDGHPERFRHVVMEGTPMDAEQARRLLEVARDQARRGSAHDLQNTLGRLRNMAVTDIERVQAMVAATPIESTEPTSRQVIDRFKEDLAAIAQARDDEARQREMDARFHFLFGVGVQF